MPRWAYWLMWVVVVACLIAIASSCATIHGPCTLGSEDEGTQMYFASCEEGGSMVIVAPAHAIQEVGLAKRPVRPPTMPGGPQEDHDE